MTTDTAAMQPAVRRRENLAVIAAIGMAMFVTTFDITAVVMIMPRVKEDLDLDIGGFAWVMDAYSLAFTVFLMGAGVLADRYGRRRGLLAGNAIFLLASLLCVLAKSETALLLGRTLQGVGAAFMVCAGLAVIGHRYVNPTERAAAFGLLGTINGAAMALGPTGGGMIADAFGWHWVFFINIPICLGVIAVALWVIEDSKDPAQRKIDVSGLATITAFLVTTVWFLLHGANVGGLELPLWAALGLVIALGATFVRIQRRASQPLLQLKLFASKAFAGLCLVPVALSVSYWAVLIYLPLFLQQRLGSTLSQASLLMLAPTLPMVFLPIFSARLAAKTSTRAFFTWGLVAVAVGVGVVALGAQTQSLPASLLGMAIAGSGTALLNPLMTSTLVGMVPREQAGAASAITVILRQGGFALGIALLAGALRTFVAIAPGGGLQPYALLFALAAAVAAVSAVFVFSLMTPPATRS
ncbi:MAG: Major Facilitator Superfamily protein [Myxococcaceae bacterium]|nr:Major Facilitator Superfamily protein [Myxococcaceae bacterium]